MKEVSAGGVVYRFRNGSLQVLMIEDRYGKWTLPKGKQEAGETVEETALREIREETGIHGEIMAHLETVHYQYKRPEQRAAIDKNVHYFLVHALSGTEKPQLEEINGALWLSENAARERQQQFGYGNNTQVLECALKRLRGEMERRQIMSKPLSASIIDHTLLKPEATSHQIDQLCHEALTYKFAAVCVNPGWVKHCAKRLKNSSVKVCTVVGFPLGATTTNCKVAETEEAIRNGATEVDMVINIGWLKSGMYKETASDIRAVVQACETRALVKVILETGLLTDEEKRTACQISQEAGAAFVKTSTGFAGSGATTYDIALMRKAVGPEMGVKASGGIRDASTAQAMVNAGATRIGASASVAIIG